MSERVLVCGGRDYSDGDRVSFELRKIKLSRGIDVVIHGGASGADELAAEWAKHWGIPTLVGVADWRAHGRAAGPLRNAAMLRDHKPTLVLAFPGGRGTANMVGKARKAGVEVLLVGGAA